MNEIELKNKEFCIQSNILSRAMYYCTITERRIIALGIARMQERTVEYQDRFFPTFGVELSASEILRAFGKRNTGSMIKQVNNAVEALQERLIKWEEKGIFYSHNWFISSCYNSKNGEIVLIFNPFVALAILNNAQGYSKLDFVIMGNITSNYGLGFYELAKSYQGFKGKDGNKKNQWFWIMSVQELRNKFQIKDNDYEKTENLIQSVITRPLENLNKANPSFRIDCEKIKKGLKTVGFKFTCTELKQELKITKKMSKVEKLEIAEINEEEKRIEMLLKKYPEEYSKLLDKVKKQSKLNGFKGFGDDIIAKSKMLEAHEKEL